MQEKGCPRIKEDTRQYRYPSKRNEIDREIEPQGETSQGNDDKHLQAEERDRSDASQIRDAEHIQINHKEAKEKSNQHCLSEDRERALAMPERFIFVCPAQGLKNLIIALRDYFPFVNNFFSFLHKTLGRRNSSQEFGTHIFRPSRIKHQIGSAVITEFLTRRHGGIDLRNRIFGLLDCDTRIAFFL